MKLIRIMAFWQNDLPEGFGVGLEQAETGQPLGEFFDNLCLEYRKMYRQAGDELLDQMLEQNKMFGKLHGERNLTIEATTMAVMNVWLLQLTGRIPTDEYNGVQLMYKGTPDSNEGYTCIV